MNRREARILALEIAAAELGCIWQEAGLLDHSERDDEKVRVALLRLSSQLGRRARHMRAGVYLRKKPVQQEPPRDIVVGERPPREMFLDA